MTRALAVSLLGCLACVSTPTATTPDPRELAVITPTIVDEPASPEPAPREPDPPARDVGPDVGIDPDAIRQVVRAHVEAVHACYELGGEDGSVYIAIDFTIGPDGKVAAANAVAPEDFPHPEIPACIVAELLTWTFPPPRHGGTVHVSYPRN